ncbi:adenosine receptor A2a-like [Glandiceps talaboti]
MWYVLTDICFVSLVTSSSLLTFLIFSAVISTVTIANGKKQTDKDSTATIEMNGSQISNRSGEAGVQICGVDMLPSYVAVALVTSILVFAILLGNLLVIVSIYRFNNLQTVTNYFVCSLACADLLVTITTVTNAGCAVGLIPMSGSIYYCMMLGLIATWGRIVSLFHLLVIAVDRYLAITSPLTYNARMTPKITKSILFTLWLLPLLNSILSYFTMLTIDGNANQFSCYWAEFLPKQYLRISVFVTTFIGPFLMMSLLYMRIFVIVRQQKRKILSGLPSDGKGTYKKDVKAVKMLAIIIGAFVICWLPVYTFITFSPHEWPTCGMSWQTFILFSLATSNSALNPVIYAYKNIEFREAFRKLLKHRLYLVHGINP